jgi:putative methyltransferase (TIGR04325 family)
MRLSVNALPLLRLIPPPLKSAFAKISDKVSGKRYRILWQGEYSSWDEALSLSTGYSSDNILQKVKDSTLKVKNGEAVFERDSVLFPEIEYSWPILSGLMWAAACNKGHLDVLDFGGSLGTSYFQNRKFLSNLPEVHWSVVEQPNFVSCGQAYIQDHRLSFYASVEQCLENRDPNVVLFSGVLSHIPDWLTVLKSILSKKIPIILVDRTPFTLDGKERITIQTVPEWIYSATYPCRFFNEQNFIQVFEDAGYELLESFSALDRTNIPSVFKGFIFTYKNYKNQPI